MGRHCPRKEENHMMLVGACTNTTACRSGSCTPIDRKRRRGSSRQRSSQLLAQLQQLLVRYSRLTVAERLHLVPQVRHVCMLQMALGPTSTTLSTLQPY